jgi:hypothetical protein
MLVRRQKGRACTWRARVVRSDSAVRSLHRQHLPLADCRRVLRRMAEQAGVEVHVESAGTATGTWAVRPTSARSTMRTGADTT